MSEETLRTREQQPEAFTWDLTSLYANADQYESLMSGLDMKSLSRK